MTQEAMMIEPLMTPHVPLDDAWNNWNASGTILDSDYDGHSDSSSENDANDEFLVRYRMCISNDNLEIVPVVHTLDEESEFVTTDEDGDEILVVNFTTTQVVSRSNVFFRAEGIVGYWPYARMAQHTTHDQVNGYARSGEILLASLGHGQYVLVVMGSSRERMGCYIFEEEDRIHQACYIAEDTAVLNAFTLVTRGERCMNILYLESNARKRLRCPCISNWNVDVVEAAEDIVRTSTTTTITLLAAPNGTIVSRYEKRDINRKRRAALVIKMLVKETILTEDALHLVRHHLTTCGGGWCLETPPVEPAMSVSCPVVA